jgi:hypothetical protein
MVLKEKIDVIFEGKTEESVLEALTNDVTQGDKVVRNKICTSKLNPIIVADKKTGKEKTGQDAIPEKIAEVLKDLPFQPDRILRVLVIWDQDSKNHSARCDSVLGVVRKFAKNARLEKLPGYNNVYVLHDGPYNLRLTLYIASECWDPSLQKTASEQNEIQKTTTDDYVLKLALKDSIASSLLASKKKPDWKITTEKLIEKVTKEIPELLKQNGIPPLSDAKEYVRFYAALLSLPTSPAIFAAKTLAHADTSDIEEVFASLIAAIKHLESAR